MNQQPLDIGNGIGYNVSNNGDYELIDMSQAEPINDLECTHATLIPDPEDKIGDAIYYGCSNLKCGRGWYIRPHANKNIT
jgi:hypothetical protein